MTGTDADLAQRFDRLEADEFAAIMEFLAHQPNEERERDAGGCADRPSQGDGHDH